MRKNVIRSILFTIASFVIVWGMTAGIAYGASVFHKSLNATVQVKGEAKFDFFEEDDDDHPITRVNLPDVVPGGTSTFTVYLKNTGSVPGTITAGTNSVSTSKGTLTLTFDGQNQKTLAPGEVTKVVGILKVSKNVESGPFSFDFSIDAYSDGAPATTSTPSPGTTTTSKPAQLVGQQLFQTYCFSCHGSTPPNTNRTQAQLADFLFGHNTGSSLSASQRSAIASYIKP